MTATHQHDELSKTHVSDLVTADPRRAAVFERLGIDYCCGGKLPLSQACEDKGLDLEQVQEMLQAIAAVDSDERDWSTASIAELVEDIITRHHEFLRAELPRVTLLSHKVAKAHGARDARLLDAEHTVHSLVTELRTHLVTEEEDVFPVCIEVGEGRAEQADDIGEAIGALVDEHAAAAAHLAELRRLLDGFVPPEGACTSWRAYLDTLARIEQDLHRHVHKENHILFGKVMDRLYEEGLVASD